MTGVADRPATDVSFRPAETTDWPAIWPIVRAVLAAGDTYTYAPDIAEDEARAAWMVAGRRARTYVAEADGAIVATARLRPNQDGPGDHVANGSWMVAPAASGLGIGTRFGRYVLDEARQLGFVAMQFNAVVATNDRAIRLWRSLGFEIVGTVPDAFRHPDHGLVPLHVMYRRL